MKKLILFVLSVGLLLVLAVAAPGRVLGQGAPPPPPPPNAGTPPPGIQPPCLPTGCPTATPTVTPTSVPLTLSVKVVHKSVKVGAKQKIEVSTLPAATVHFTISFPDKAKKTDTGTANSSGKLTWTFKQPGHRTTSKSNTAKLKVRAEAHGMTLTKSKSYKIT